ncbi:MAG: cell division protein ZapB [Thermoanaerobaculia bacterium]|nr:cell division protein ZapB [Thermoanaerobaculia bacterium]
MKKTKTEGQLSLAGTEEGEILARLSERVERAVQTIQQLRRERDELRSKLEQAEGTSEEHERLVDERSEIRNRIESILTSLESLD